MHLIFMTDCFIQIIYVLDTFIYIYRRITYEIREQFRNHALVMHYNNSGKLYFHYPE